MSSISNVQREFTPKNMILNTLVENIDRKCHIEIDIRNAGIALTTPSYFNKHGNAVSAIVPEIENGKKQTLIFTKTSFSAHGLKGVLVYRIICNSQRNTHGTDNNFTIAAMWDIPSSLKRSKRNSFAVGVSQDLVANRSLCELMAKGSENWFQRKTTETCTMDKVIDGERVQICATLSDGNSAVFTLVIK